MKKDELKEYLQRDAESMRSLSFSENYIKEATSLTERWGQIGLLKGLEPYVGRQVARLMENQRLQNEDDNGTYHAPEGAHTNWVDAQWKRVSIPAIRRVFGGTPIFNLVSVQPLKGPEDNIYFTGLDERHSGVMVQTKTRSIGRDWWQGVTTENDRHSLDLEANALAVFSQRYTNEITKEVINDLLNNSGSRANAEYENEEQLLSLVEGMSAYIAAKINGRDATWIVANSQVSNLLKPFMEWQEDDSPYSDDEGKNHYDLAVKYRGKVKDKWKLYENPTQAPGKVLMGHKDNNNHYFSGYFYCPYRPFTHQPGWWKDDGTHQHGFLYSRYGKKLGNQNFYGVIDISNLPEEIQEETESEE